MLLKPSYRVHTRSILFHRHSILLVPRVSLFTLEEDCILEGGMLEGQSHAGHHIKPLWLVAVFLPSLLVWKGHCYESLGDADSFRLVLPSSWATAPSVHLRERQQGVVVNIQLWRR